MGVAGLVRPAGPMQLLHLLTSRPVIVGLAIVGALIATLAGILQRHPAVFDTKSARALLRVGYAITWASVVAFIAAGFLSSR